MEGQARAYDIFHWMVNGGDPYELARPAHGKQHA